ncbi:MAG: pyridoxal-phosphate dependent enzyme [Bacteroidetes bacterium]|nr:pyridoxal-phosphate dependent enzyme [Bacteroidota bacterium]
MNLNLNIPSPLQKLDDPLFTAHQLSVYLKRDDLIDAEISGNKWRKLKFNLEKFRVMKYDAILTFGGAYSNHIAATAAAGRMLKIPTLGIIRGDELTIESNKTLSKAHADGMQLEFVPRAVYEQRYERIYHEELRAKYGNVLIIEEGGANHLGVFGVGELLAELPFEPDHLYVAAGTGTTAAGLLYASETVQVNAVAALKGGDFLKADIQKLLYYAMLDEADSAEKMKRLVLRTEFHFGGYGKYTPELLRFMKNCALQHQVPLDQVYTAKMMYAFYADLRAGKFEPQSSIVLVHTGGIQGAQLQGI